jgi:hypothetical protein
LVVPASAEHLEIQEALKPRSLQEELVVLEMLSQALRITNKDEAEAKLRAKFAKAEAAAKPVEF